jgi:hypothetical protein
MADQRKPAIDNLTFPFSPSIGHSYPRIGPKQASLALYLRAIQYNPVPKDRPRVGYEVNLTEKEAAQNERATQFGKLIAGRAMRWRVANL